MKKLSIGLLFLTIAHMACADHPVGGRSYLRTENPFGSGAPMRVGSVETMQLADRKADNNSSFHVVAYGGFNGKRSSAASYFMPGANTELNAAAVTASELTNITSTRRAAFVDDGEFQGPLSAKEKQTFDSIHDTGANTKTLPATLPNRSDGGVATEPNQALFNDDNGGTITVGKLQTNLAPDSANLQPWNFGITHATVFDTPVSDPSNVPTFKASIKPELKRSEFGIGAQFRHHFGDEATGWFVNVATSIARVRAEMKLNEEIETEAGTTLAAWTKAGFPAAGVAPTNLTEAFAQEAWNYGKIDGAQTKTRISDIELKVGYQAVAEQSHAMNTYLGVVVPLGNKAAGVYMAEPVVGNGKHFALMWGSNLELELSSDQDMRITYRMDVDSRYLFKNTQKRSFDTKNNGAWSRYMMVWKDQQSFVDAGNVAAKWKAFEPGINVFTQDVYVTPKFQGRLNQALHIQSENMCVELGWNIFARQQEQVELAADWVAPAIAAANAFNGIVAIAPLRAINNDNNLSYAHFENPGDLTIAKTQTYYDAHSVKEDDLDLSSAASPMTIAHTPYIMLGHSWDGDSCPCYLGVGASYEFSYENRSLNQWNLWGSFSISF